MSNVFWGVLFLLVFQIELDIVYQRYANYSLFPNQENFSIVFSRITTNSLYTLLSMLSLSGEVDYFCFHLTKNSLILAATFSIL